ncbi:MAG: carbon-nitrogen family hydrolase [Opitutaceae bacterium]
MKIALAQFAVARGDVAKNHARIAEFVVEAASCGAGVVCFPEMCTTGFDWAVNRALLERAESSIMEIQKLALEHEVAICGSVLENTESGKPANTLYFIEANGSISAKYRKTHLFSLFHEEQHVEAGNEIVVAETSLGKLGCSICYDLRFPELFRACMSKGAEVQLLPAAFPHPRLAHWQTLIRARAVENQAYFIAVNQCGTESHGSDVGETHYFGHSMVVDPWGEVLVEADESEGLFSANIDINAVAKTRSKLTALDDRRPELY